MANHKPVAVLGAGSWGTALALVSARNGHDTLLWSFEKDHVLEMIGLRGNRTYLPGIVFPENLTPSYDLVEILQQCDDLLIAVPSFAFLSVLREIKPHLTERHRIVWATKGLDPQSHRLLHEVVEAELGSDFPMAIITGPSFAKEVALGQPTAVVVASNDPNFAADLADRFHSHTFRVYRSDDIIGLEVGGAVKNVLAIAAGIADGLGFGANARTALITRGLAEIERLGEALGAKPETLTGLAGIGDLMLTCTDNQSRNRRAGLAMARGLSSSEAEAEIGQVVEGIKTAKEIHDLAAKVGVEMPISEQVYAVVYEGVAPRDAVEALLNRSVKSEFQSDGD